MLGTLWYNHSFLVQISLLSACTICVCFVWETKWEVCLINERSLFRSICIIISAVESGLHSRLFLGYILGPVPCVNSWILFTFVVNRICSGLTLTIRMWRDLLLDLFMSHVSCVPSRFKKRDSSTLKGQVQFEDDSLKRHNDKLLLQNEQCSTRGDVKSFISFVVFSRRTFSAWNENKGHSFLLSRPVLG